MNADLTLEKAITPACQRRACQEIKFAVVRGVEARSLTLTISILTKQLQRQKGERAQQQQQTQTCLSGAEASLHFKDLLKMREITLPQPSLMWSDPFTASTIMQRSRKGSDSFLKCSCVMSVGIQDRV